MELEAELLMEERTMFLSEHSSALRKDGLEPQALRRRLVFDLGTFRCWFGMHQLYDQGYRSAYLIMKKTIIQSVSLARCLLK